jgi:hypothetical protein
VGEANVGRYLRKAESMGKVRNTYECFECSLRGAEAFVLRIDFVAVRMPGSDVNYPSVGDRND